jgi:tRNA threonylcarbamoyladenosine biosynthesis protein TsaE
MIIHDEQQMFQYGFNLGQQLKARDLVAIDGPLGAGKTVLCRGILHAIGYEGEVASPSYAIVHNYDPPLVHIPIVHADLYRINSPDELDELGLLDDRSDCITLIEWAERSERLLELARYRITIDLLPSGARKLTITP